MGVGRVSKTKLIFYTKSTLLFFFFLPSKRTITFQKRGRKSGAVGPTLVLID